jgi:hypothetical protein
MGRHHMDDPSKQIEDQVSRSGDGNFSVSLRNSPPNMKTESLLPCLQKPSTGHCFYIVW